MRTTALPVLAALLAGCPTTDDTADTSGPTPVEDCNDGIDNDGDGAVDCLDLGDCFDALRCSQEQDCDNGQDDDFDGSTDCEDSDCADQCAEICDDSLDNDGDGQTDCDDADCVGDSACSPVTNELDCDDGVDNDNDGQTDCDDLDCTGASVCFESDCDDGVDNDADGLIDCEDGDCAFLPACDGELDCDDQIDNDGDGLVDCADLDCVGVDCPGLVAKVTGGSLQQHLQARAQYTSCAGGSPYSYSYGYGSRIDATWTIDVQDVTGTVQRIEGGVPVATCDWGLTSAQHVARLFRINYSSTGMTWSPPVRNGFFVDSGCGTSGSGFLPRYLFGPYGSSIAAVPLPGPQVTSLNFFYNSNYTPWYVGSGTTGIYTYGYSYPGACSFVSTRERSIIVDALESGSEWATALP